MGDGALNASDRPARERVALPQTRSGTLATIAAIVGAIGSLVLTLRAGSSNRSVVLMAMFALWVTIPFVAMLLADDYFRRTGTMRRSALHVTMAVVAVASLLLFSGVIAMPSGTKNAFVFIVAPLGFWILIISAFALTWKASNTRQSP